MCVRALHIHPLKTELGYWGACILLNHDFRQIYICPGIKKNEIIPFAETWMDLETIILSEISQTEKDKYHMI